METLGPRDQGSLDESVVVFFPSWITQVHTTAVVAVFYASMISSNTLRSLPKPTNKLIGLDEVQSALLTSSALFVDARSHAEYVGAQDNGNRRVGHVPGAIHFDWKDGVDVSRNGVFKTKAELEYALFTERDLPSDRTTPLVTYCQRGIRAAHAAFVLSEVLGFEDVKIYEDSMLQYLNRDDTAIERST
jgi:thiosulfate/3-mercaptopyruvate sulfurtransferase